MASRGYGVHSPLGFRLVKHVIRPPRDVIYYGEERLEDFPQPFSLVRKARVLLRFTAEMQPSYVWVSPSAPDIFLEALRMAGCVVRIYDGKVFPDEISHADMILLYKAKLTKKILSACMNHKTALAGFDLDSKMMKLITGQFAGGVLMDGVSGILVVNVPNDERHIYKVKRF